MAKIDPFTPTAADKFTFGLWTVGKTGSDPFGGDVREQLTPAQIVDLLGKAGGVHGVNFHDNDLIPIVLTQTTISPSPPPPKPNPTKTIIRK